MRSANGNVTRTALKDVLSGGNGKDTSRGSERDDDLSGGNGSDMLFGMGGDDKLGGGNGSDLLNGGAGDDIVSGGRGRDIALYSGALADYRFIRHSNGSIQVIDLRASGEDDRDTVIGVEYFQFSDGLVRADQLPSVMVRPKTEGGVTLTLESAPLLTADLGTEGVDDIVYSGGGTLVLPDTFENLTLTGDSPSSAIGNALSNTLIGNAAANVLNAGPGDDLVIGGGGEDTLIAGSGEGDDAYDGGADSDTIVFSSTSLGVVVNLAEAFAEGSEIGRDSITGVENVVAGSGDDWIAGDTHHNRLEGAAGYDVLAGGGGADTFAGTVADLDGDRILDFGSDDRIRIDGAQLDAASMQRRHWDGDTLLEIWDDTGSIQTVIRLAGRVDGSITTTSDAEGTSISIGPNGTGKLIDFDGGVWLNGNEYVQNGIIASTLDLIIEDSFTTDGPDAELTSSRSGATLRAHPEGLTPFTVTGFSSGLLDPDGGGFIRVGATYMDDTGASWRSADGGETWIGSNGELTDDIVPLLTNLRFLNFDGPNWWVDDVLIA